MKIIKEQTEKSLLVFVIVLVMYAQCFEDTSSCGEKFSTRKDQNVFSKHRLRSRVVENKPISRPLECYINCMKNCRCVSYNICNHGKLCELNSQKKDDNISLYEPNDDCDYHEYKFSKQDPGSECLDQCCSTSQPCLNKGRCKPTCMTNGHRFICQNCSDGYSGNRCENPPRSCSAYATSPNRTEGGAYMTIFAPDNTPYKVFCFFHARNRTLVMSFSRENSPHISSHSLAEDNPHNEDNPNWDLYRLSLSRMKSIRENSLVWHYTCDFNIDEWKWADYLSSVFNKTDLLTYDSSVVDDCRKVSQVNIRGKYCQHCKVGMTQTPGSILRLINNNVNCGGLGVNVYTCANGSPVTYFGDYTCYISKFRCSSKGSATTQLWFSD